MLQTLTSYTLEGLEPRRVKVEVDVHRGISSFAVVGLPDSSVRETRERVRAALVNSGFEFPLRRIVVNLAPASLRRAGSGLDLVIAVGILLADRQLTWTCAAKLAFIGELALDGSTRAIAGALPIAEAAREDGMSALVLPEANAFEAALASGIDLLAIDGLARVSALASGTWEPRRPAPSQAPAPQGDPDFADLRGQDHLRRALEVAAGGGHNVLMIGPPGAGKSLAASRLPSILPPLSGSESLEVAAIASATGRFGPSSGVIRPFRAPHHAISAPALVGGGRPTRPGEATLAHRGTLFLDELSEFGRDALEALRPVLRSGRVVVSRRDAKTILPANLMLLAAANPCPCGRGSEDPACTCSAVAVQRFQGRISSVLEDAIDISVTVVRPSLAEVGGGPGEPSADIRARVIAARERQELRLGVGRCNAEMTATEARACTLTSAAKSLLAETYERQRFAGRAHDRVLRLAQTLADLAGADQIAERQIAEALGLRRRGRRER